MFENICQRNGTKWNWSPCRSHVTPREQSHLGMWTWFCLWILRPMGGLHGHLALLLPCFLNLIMTKTLNMRSSAQIFTCHDFIYTKVYGSSFGRCMIWLSGNKTGTAQKSGSEVAITERGRVCRFPKVAAFFGALPYFFVKESWSTWWLSQIPWCYGCGVPRSPQWEASCWPPTRTQTSHASPPSPCTAAW